MDNTRYKKVLQKKAKTEKFLKTRIAKSEAACETYKNMFETIKRKSKRKYYSQKILKANKPGSPLPTKLVVNKNDVTSEIGIANEFSKFFAKIGPELAEKIRTASRTFESFLNKIDTTMPADPVTINELKEAFFSLKTNKRPGCDEISSNVIKNCFSELNYRLKHLFGKSIENGVFPNALKIARVNHFLKVEILVI